MKLYLLTQNKCVGYDTYSSCVVCACSSTAARKIHPQFTAAQIADQEESGISFQHDAWPAPHFVSAKYLGIAAKHSTADTVYCASYHAG